MDRTELLAATVHQVWAALSALHGTHVEPWDKAPGWQRSVTYHAVRFLDALDVDNYSIEKLTEASVFAWNKFLERQGQRGTLTAKAAQFMVATYLVIRKILSTQDFTE